MTLRVIHIIQAIGGDQIHTKPLRDSSDIIAPYITFIFNLCVKEGLFPHELKPARVTPIFKKENPFIVSNYRPVSIIITLSKIFELDQLMSFLLENNIITKFQYMYGFLKKTSTSTD
eukprot:Lithocolla_globosa_v1_NODE_7286_length_967_cov_43.992325.p1 type:complete len:117 gc:universal NODE_7286_length_967_cov_43.992325:223-573(+)